jgi:two-component system nitrogen regulation sensor histidine kinase NtrY
MSATRSAKLPLWRRRLAIAVYRSPAWMRTAELAVGVLAAITAMATFAWLRAESGGTGLLPPPLTALVLLANLLPAIALLMLIGNRVARKRASQTQLGSKGRLHVRLVAIFSTIASVPVVLMVLIGSLLFQYGVDTWYSNRARGMFENTTALAQQLYAEQQQRVTLETRTMAGDVSQILAATPIESRGFAEQFAYQLYLRELSEGAVLAITAENGVQTLAVVDPYERGRETWVPPDVAKKLVETRDLVFRDTGSRMEAVTPLPNSNGLFLYASRVADSATLTRAKRAESVLKDYNALLGRARAFQIRINGALYVLSILLIGGAVWIALNVADRLVRPVGELVGAARKVADGDLAVKVSDSQSRDEVGLLSRAFNRMTDRLDEQNRTLTSANALLDRRRALIEAVLSNVSAGVIAISADRAVRIVNNSASELLRVDRDDVIGDALADVAPELAAMLERNETEAILPVTAGGEPRTLAVKIARDEVGHVLTFDDITNQLNDQRRAAWSDVARRVAHEIKNPLTPIQLAAERLKRRFSKEIESDPAAFERLTDTIVRQVGDLRRMVDEFSSFARMPKPVFARESIVDVAREAVFLHEVAHPQIAFAVDAPEPAPQIVCDRRQLAQALSNIVKNGVEAIGQRPQGAEAGRVSVSIAETGCGTLAIAVTDNGIGLPVERDRIIEPYMTTRAGGTGLGLAIVKKIVEEHVGSIAFADNPGGGTIATITLDPAMLAAAAAAQGEASKAARDEVPAALTRTRSG